MSMTHPAAVALPAHGAIAPPRALASTWLARMATLWCAVAVAGQLFQAAYVATAYGRPLLAGQPERWGTATPSAWAPGDPVANGLLALHLLFAVVIVASGALQLLPALRRRAPRVHHWNGRLFLLSALLMALGGLVMVATRPTIGDLSQQLGVSLNGLLILAFAGLAWRAAVQRRFDQHRRWALRLWLAVGGVWFFRIGLMAWLVVHRAPVGFDPKTFTGPLLSVLAFAQVLLPLAVLELYLRVRDRAGPAGQLGMAALLGGLALLTLLGVGAAGLLMWWPRMQGVSS